MTALFLTLGGLFTLVGMAIALLTAANRRGAAETKMVTRAQDAAAELHARKKIAEIKDAVAATEDVHLADLARRVLHNKP